MTLFRIRNLCVDVPGRRLLHDLSTDIPQGTVTALIGPNGSGKSTLLKTLARQMNGSGSVIFEGRELSDWARQDFARRLAFLPQNMPPAEGMTVRELIALGRYPWHGALGRFGPGDHDAVAGAMLKCGVENFADRVVDSLSGGERQRSWLAMSVAQQAGTLLLDEPISALDISHQVEVLSLLRRMCHDQNRSAVIVLHDVNMAARFCDHVVALRGGRHVFEGTTTSLMQPDALGEIFGLQMQILTCADGTPVAFPT
ncbi:ABC transporter ATP-binding protein [Paracoccus homiensis]|uniref:Iron complex transport system ATP-binding protein n=1 Tax=Paracoccus homiensis TaxID=364199 RepID=A0A1I0JEJ7_9RHOB|nr:ATP-binding cassette domain-containing protein [Paracoccus homiensis]SEU08462.1 iron complex transport system ATP-binding protein [Paracoccus homiensis]